MRLAACFDTPLEIIEPCGFPLTDKALRRTMMDYGASATCIRRDGWDDFLAAPERTGSRLVLLSTSGEHRLGAYRFAAGDTLLLGRESAGAPDHVHARVDARLRIPIATGARSLNVTMAAGLALWEALRQTGSLPV